MTRACSVVTQLCMHSQSLHTVAALSLALFSLCCLFVCRRGGWRLLPLQPESEWSCRGSSVLNLCRVLIRPDRPPQEVMRLEGARSNHVTSCTRGSGRWDEMWEKNKQKKTAMLKCWWWICVCCIFSFSFWMVICSRHLGKVRKGGITNFNC